MTNQELIISRFLKQHPEYEADRKKLFCDLWGNILLDEEPRKLIAESNLRGKSLSALGVSMPESWEIKA